MSVPQSVNKAGGLESDACKEITDDGNIDNGILDNMNVDSVEENNQEDDQNEDAKSREGKIDPEDPLYGIDERLKYTKVDDETKEVLKQKLIEA